LINLLSEVQKVVTISGERKGARMQCQKKTAVTETAGTHRGRRESRFTREWEEEQIGQKPVH